MLRQLSASERKFITHGCDQGIRCDGRGPDDFRTISIENNVFPQSNGSARVRLSDCVDILCSIKADVCEPDPKRPKQGKADVHVDISPSCRHGLDDRTLAALGQEIAQTLQTAMLGAGSLGWEELSIIDGKWCWQLFIDITVLLLDGDPTDMCAVAALAALHCTQLPRLHLKVGKLGLVDDFDVSTDTSENVALPIRDLPVLVSLHKVGNGLLLDSSHDEQQCSDSAICLAVTSRKQICCTKMIKSGGLAAADLASALERGCAAAAGIFHQLQHFLAQADARAQEERMRPDLAVDRLGLMV